MTAFIPLLRPAAVLLALASAASAALADSRAMPADSMLPAYRQALMRQIGTWLEAHASTYKRVREQPPQDRITRSAWFERKHRELDAAVWQRTSVGSRANCMACHTRADRGDFDDDRVRIPK